MSRVASLVLLLLLASVAVQAQSDSSAARVSWFFITHSGALLGKKGYGTSATVSAMQAIRYERYAFGIGVGYDAYYDWNTLPLFAGASYDLSKSKKRSMFVQMNTGYSAAWNPGADRAEIVYFGGGGFFHHPLIGYKVKHGKVSIHFTAGYKWQRLTWSWVYPPSKTTMQRDIRRMSVQMGIAF